MLRRIQGSALIRFVLATILMASLEFTHAQDFKAGSDAVERGDFQTALQEWRPLAEAGDPAAQFNLAMLYARGDGVPQDYDEAARWFLQAAEQGQVEAQARIGGMYARGLSFDQDYTKAAEWFSKAAEQHHAISQYELGILYANGQGVHQDYSTAYFWFTLAGLQHFPPAQESQDRLRSLIPGVQIGYVEQRVRDWLEENVAEPEKTPDEKDRGSISKH